MNVPSSMPNPKSSRWGGGVAAGEMREVQWVKPEDGGETAAACGVPRAAVRQERARGAAGSERRSGPVQFGQTRHLLLQVKSSDDAWCVPDG